MTYNCKYNTYVYEILNIENIQNILEIFTSIKYKKYEKKNEVDIDRKYYGT